MSSAQLTVLIVDDDFRVASVHEGFVERVPGFRVVGKAYSAAEALEQARLTRPDVVLMDVYLPDGDGLQVIRQLLEEPEAPIVLVVSAATEVATVRRAVQLGAVHYLVKPFGFAALAERLTAIRNAQAHFDDWPAEPTQEDISRIYDLLRPERTGAGAGAGRPEDSHLAPTLRLVYGAIASSPRSLSASEIAASVGISRATAQRYLAQLEQSRLIKLELRYGATGRPEHRYSAVPR